MFTFLDRFWQKKKDKISKIVLLMPYFDEKRADKDKVLKNIFIKYFVKMY